MAGTVTSVEELGARVSAALGARLVCFLVYGSAARRGAPGSSTGVDTVLIADGVDQRLLDELAATVAPWVRAGNPPPIVFSESEWQA